MTREKKYYVKVTLSAYVIWLILFESIGRYAATLPTSDLTSFLDRQIPVVPGFVWIYQLCYLFPFVPLLISTDWHRFNRGLLAIIIANLVAFTVFLTFPIAIPRPALGGGISERALAFIYSIDFYPGACELPSLHVTFAWLVYFICRGQGLSRWKEGLVLLTAVGISASTLFVKQHILLDVAAGMTLATFSWWLAKYLYIRVSDRSHDGPQALKHVSRKLLPIAPLFGLFVLLFIWH
jgi:membrane-associated phospholipid phosphatase